MSNQLLYGLTRPRLVCAIFNDLFAPLTITLDSPITDLYDTEGTGGFPGIAFKARPVVGGHFAFLALERACDGKAVAALDFLNAEDAKVVGEMGDGEL